MPELVSALTRLLSALLLAVVVKLLTKVNKGVRQRLLSRQRATRIPRNGGEAPHVLPGDADAGCR